jgi:hypothetical protein
MSKHTINFKEEIIEKLKLHNYSVNDIAYVVVFDRKGNRHCVDANEFLEYAARINYDNGYGTDYIETNIQIVMKDGNYFSRNEYDGSEWFNLNIVPSLDEAVEAFDENEMVVIADWKIGFYAEYHNGEKLVS